MKLYLSIYRIDKINFPLLSLGFRLSKLSACVFFLQTSGHWSIIYIWFSVNTFQSMNITLSHVFDSPIYIDFVEVGLPVQGKLSITRSLGPGKFVRYIRYLIIRAVIVYKLICRHVGSNFTRQSTTVDKINNVQIWTQKRWKPHNFHIFSLPVVLKDKHIVALLEHKCTNKTIHKTYQHNSHLMYVLLFQV